MLSPIPSDSDQFFQWRRENFPFFESKICLTHASVSPLPKRAGDAIAEYAQQISKHGQFDYLHMATYLKCKERIAAMLGYGAIPDEVAFASSTSHALGLVATSFPWEAGDNCVVADGDFPANVLIWKNLAYTHGVEVKLVPPTPTMELTWDDIESVINEKTRLVSLSAVNFLSGASIDLNKIGGELHARGIKFCVDGIQALGAVQLNLQHVDFVCADAHKWLLGPNGAAFMWARTDVLQTMRPQILGWLATAKRMSWYEYDTTPFPTAERFEPGARNYLGVIGMEASLSVIQEIGIEKVEERVVRLRMYGAQAVEATGATMLFMAGPEHRSGMFSFRFPDRDMVALNEELDKKFALALRQDRNDDYWIRASPHFMNCESDLDELAAALT